MDLVGAASAYSVEVYVKHHKSITDLLEIWEGKSYYQPSYFQKLRATASNASRFGFASTDDDSKPSEEVLSEGKKDAPYLLPPSHGDALTPFYDLPAGNMMPQITLNSARAINPQRLKALEFTAGPADENLVTAVKDFLKNVEPLDAHGFENREDDVDIDELGQFVLGDEISGKALEGEGYYGWSRAFCENMKTRGLGLGEIGRTVELVGSIYKGLGPRKRRRYSDSGSSESRDRAMDRSRSGSLSSNQGSRHRNGQRSTSESRHPSRDQRRYQSLRSRSQSRSPSYPPPQTVPNIPRPPPQADPPPMQQPRAHGSSPPPSVPFPHPFLKGFPVGPGGAPIPPPPPPNYHGPWPPPPPPIPYPTAGNAVPALAPPTGKVGPNNSAPTFSGVPQLGFQSHTPLNFGGWSRQQFGHVSGHPHEERGGVQQPFNGSAQDGRGRGYGRGGRTR